MLHLLQPTDLWPWLGRSWKLPRSVRPDSGVQSRIPIGGCSFVGIVAFAIAASQGDLMMAWTWGVSGIIAQIYLDRLLLHAVSKRAAFAKDAIASLDSLTRLPSSQTSRPVHDARYTIRLLAGSVLVFSLLWTSVLSLLLMPAILEGRTDFPFVSIWIVAPARAGLLVPVLLSPPWQMILRASGGAAGFGKQARIEQPTAEARKSTTPVAASQDGEAYSRVEPPEISAPSSSQPTVRTENEPFGERARFHKERILCVWLGVQEADLDLFSESERPTVLGWLSAWRWNAAPLRPWWAAADLAFISYRWCDADFALAEEIRKACEAADINSFWDNSVGRKGDVFRPELAAHLGPCTHFFLVVSLETLNGGVVLREIETAMERWPKEKLPTMICVVEPEVANEMRRNSKVPLAIRFLLTFAPQMTPAEVAQPALVRYIVEFTRREGKLYDWLPFLSPATGFARAIRLPGIGEG